MAQRVTAAVIAQRLVDKVKDATGIQMPLPTVTVKAAAWVTDEDLPKLPGIGAGLIRVGNDSASLADALPELKELAKPGEKPAVMIQVGVPFSEPFDTFQGDRSFLTVLDARPESPAENLDEVRSTVINDRKKADAYAALAAELPAFEAAALSGTLEELADHVKTRTGLTADYRPSVFATRTRLSPSDAPFNAKPFLTALGRRLDSIDPTVPLERASPTDLAFAVALPGKNGIAVAKITSYSPATIEVFRRAAGVLAPRMAADLVDGKDDLLNLDAMTRRLNVITPRVPGESAESKPAKPDAKPQADSKPATR
jgi:hypothetical protein